MGVNTVAELPAVPQIVSPMAIGEKWKRQGVRGDGKPCCMKVQLMERGAPDQARIRLEFGGGAITYGHPFVKSVRTEHYQGHEALFALTPRTQVKYRCYDDHVKQEIWLHADPGTNVFEELMWLEGGLSLVNSDGHWTFNDASGLPVGSIPPLVVRAINVQVGTLLSTTASMDVLPQADGSYLLRVTVDPTWLAERFAAGDVVVIDPTTVSTSTASTATAYSNQCKVRRHANGVLFGLFYDGSNMVCRYSSDGGSTWQTPAVGATVSAGGAHGSVFIDPDDYVHVAMQNGAGTVFYYRGTPNTGRTEYTWSSLQVSSSYDYYPDVVAHADGTGWKAHFVWSYQNGTTNYAKYERINITSGGTLSADLGGLTIGGSYGVSAHTYPSISIDSSKNLYAVWSSGTTGTSKGIRCKKASYPTWSWGSEEDVDTGNYANSGTISSTLDSSGRVIAAYRKSSDSNTAVKERSTGGTWSDRTPGTISSPTSVSVVTDSDDNIHLLYTASGAYRRKYTRGSGAWDGATTTIDATTTSNHISARRDTSGMAVDALHTTGAGSPYSVVHYRLALNQTPTAPTITVASAFDATDGAAVTITHQDPDSGDTMSAYALKRVNGATTQYWDAGTNNWTTIETYNTASGTSATISAANNATKWTNNTTYQLSASTRDAAGATGPYNSTPATVKASAKPTVTITTPAAAGVVTGSSLTAVWTVSDPEGLGQSKYKVRLLDSAGTTELWSSGEVTDSAARSKTVGYTLVNSTTYKCEVTAWDGDGVASAAVTHTFSTSFTAPITPTITVTPNADQFPPYLAVTVDDKQTDTTTEGGSLTLTGGAAVSGTDAVLDAQNERAAVQNATLGTGKQRFTLTAKDTTQVASDVTMEVYNVTDSASVTSSDKTMTTDFAAYTLDFAATAGKTYELRVTKATATANTITVDKVQVAPVTTTASNKIQRSADGGSTWTTMTTGLAVGGTYKDYTPASEQAYLYRAVAVGSNSTETNSANAVGSLTRECWWFIPRDTPSSAIPFKWNREASWQHDRAFVEVETRGPVTVHFFGGKKREVINISATYLDYTDAELHVTVNLTREEWRQRFVDQVGVQGYLISPDAKGLVKRGILEPPSGRFGVDQVVNAYGVQVRFVEKAGIP